jgi:hypothetical protein
MLHLEDSDYKIENKMDTIWEIKAAYKILIRELKRDYQSNPGINGIKINLESDSMWVCCTVNLLRIICQMLKKTLHYVVI